MCVNCIAAAEPVQRAEPVALDDAAILGIGKPYRQEVCHVDVYSFNTREFLSVSRRILASQPPAVAVPDGYALVPVEPTEKMLIDGMEADCLGRPSIDDETHVRGIWCAMLAAAPQAAVQAPNGWPTDEMVIRGAETLHDLGVRFEENSRAICIDIAESVFIAMLDAAPIAAQKGGA